MPIPSVNLDDRNFDQLVAEARALIPRYFPAWTDYNESDPGITVLELFAFLTEALIYRINRVPDRSLERFAELVGVTRLPGEAIEQTLARALAALKQQYRAVTDANFEDLALQAAPGKIARSKAVVVSPATTIVATVQSTTGTNIAVLPFDSGIYGLRRGAMVTISGKSPQTTLAADIRPAQSSITQIAVTDATFAAALHPGDEIEMAVQANVFPLDQIVKVIIVPADNPRATAAQSADLRQKVFQFLDARRLITTRVNVVAPDYTPLKLALTVVRDAARRLSPDLVASNISAGISAFLDPLAGGMNGIGWPFGRSVYRSELDRLVEGLDGVDHLRQLLLNGDENIAEIRLVSALSLVDLQQLAVTIVDS